MIAGFSRIPFQTRYWWFEFVGLAAASVIGITVASLSLFEALLAGSAVALSLLVMMTPVTALIALLIVAPLRTLIATEASWPLPLDIGQLGLLLAFAVALTWRIIHRRPLVSSRRSPVYLPLLAYIVLGGLSVFSATSLGNWLSEWLKWVQILLLIVLIVTNAYSRQWEFLILGLVLAATTNALIGLYEFFGGSGAIHLVVEGRFFRAFGTFGQPNPFGGFMGLIVPVALMAALGSTFRASQKWHTHPKPSLIGLISPIIFYLVCSGLMLAALIASWSRGSWLGCAISLSAVLLVLPRTLWQSMVLLIAGLSVFGVLYTADVIPEAVVSRMASSVQELSMIEDVRGVYITPENYPVIERLAHWQAAINMAQNNPWSGVGLGNYENAYAQYKLMNWDLSLGHAHNIYLNVLAETGIIGFVGYIVMWVWIMLLTWRARAHPDPFARCIAVGLFGTWVYLAVHSITDNLYVNNLFLHLGVLLGVLAVLHYQIARDKRLRYV